MSSIKKKNKRLELGMVVWTFIGCLLLALTASAESKDDKYRLKAGDVLRIEVWGEPELSGDYRVNEAGVLQRAWLPEVKVAGLTIEESQAAFETTLKKYFVKPRVRVEMSDSKNQNVNQHIVVTGAVNRIGTFPYREGYTAMNAIIDAGGFTKFASPNRAKIVRGQGKNEKTIEIKLGDVVNRGDKAKDIVLMPGDVIVVPESLL